MTSSFNQHDPAGGLLSTSRRNAFTLIEILLVVTIVVIVIAITVPALGRASAASQLTAAGDLVTAKIIEAQQEAISHDSEIELRIYETQDASDVDDVLRIRSLQIFSLQPETDVPTFTANSSITQFGNGIVASSKSKLSSLVDRGFHKADGTPSKEGDLVESGRYLSIRFLPDGSTNLPPGSGPWFLTLVPVTSEATAAVPANFYTIQVDPITGRVRNFRP